MKIDIESLDLDSIGQWSRFLQWIIFLMGFLLTGYGGYCLWIEDAWIVWGTEKKFCSSLRQELDATRKQVENPELFKERSDKVRQALALVRRQLPEENQEAKRLQEIAELALQTRLQIRSVKPGPELQKGAYKEHPILLTMVGDYHGLGEWISRLSSQMPILTLQEYSLFFNKASQTLDIQLQLKTFSATEDDTILDSSLVAGLNSGLDSVNAGPLLPSNSNSSESEHLDLVSGSADLILKIDSEMALLAQKWAPFPFTANHVRSPFQRTDLNGWDKPAIEHQSMQSDPAERPKELLELYSLDSLRMIGFIETNSQVYGLLRDNGGNIHRVKIGDYLGQNEGKVEKINSDGIEILETLFKDSSAPELRKIHLPLFLETKEMS